jgi:hypothetical protein
MLWIAQGKEKNIKFKQQRADSTGQRAKDKGVKYQSADSTG